MPCESNNKPKLRPLESFKIPEGDGETIGVRDRSGLSDVVLSMSVPALQILALMDGTNTCEDIRREFSAAFGQPLAMDTLHRLIEHLEHARFLEGPGFEAFYRDRLEEYRSAGVRRMPDAAGLGLPDASGELFEELLAGAEVPPLAGSIVGLIAPHLDYPRGGPCYAVAYAALRRRKTPDRVVILGTNHFGRSASVVGTASTFQTPFGATATDVMFLERLESRCGDLRRYELDHFREHSIEMELTWLQYLFGARSFEIVAFLCPDVCGPTGTAPMDGQGVDLADFAAALREAVAEDARDTLIVAGADFSHVGAAFGEDRPLDDPHLEEVRRRDRAALGQFEANDPTGFLRCIAEDGNTTNICSAGCMFVLATALPRASGTVLRYHQAVDQAAHACVSCAAVVFTC